MSEAICIITNCRNRAPAAEPFCAEHRDSDGSGEAVETGTGSTVGDSAGLKGIAETQLGEP